MQITFSETELDWFARASHDVNPLHMDDDYAARTAYGRRVAFGILGGLAGLAVIGDRRRQRPSALTMEFRHAVIPGRNYRLTAEQGEGSVTAYLRDGDTVAVSVRAEYGGAGNPAPCHEPPVDGPLHCRDTPAALTASDVARAGVVSGTYRCDRSVFALGTPTWVEDAVDTVGVGLVELLLCTSYLVGMEIPGRQALFSKLRLSIDETPNDVDERTIAFSAQPEHYSDDFGLLRLGFHASHGTGITVTGAIDAFVRREVDLPRYEDVAARLCSPANALQGRVALVTGGSRGLGAALVQALAASGCHVYLAHRSSVDAAARVAEACRSGDGGVTVLQGDVADPAWCRTTAERIAGEHGGLDILVCNAATAPSPMGAEADHREEIRDYVASNLAVTSTPLEHLLPLVRQRSGVAVAVSSVFVDERPAAFPQYVALKDAVEAELHRRATDCPEVSFLAPRAPRMLTEMSNTPQAAVGAESPASVAASLVDTLAAEQRPGTVRVLSASELAGSSGHDAEPPQGESDDAPRAVIAATFTAEPMSPSIDYWSRELELPLSPCYADYNQVFRQLLDPHSEMADNHGGVNAVLVRVIDWLREHSGEGDPEASRQHLREVADEFVTAMVGFVRRSRSPVVLVLCPSGGHDHPAADAVANAESRLLERCRDLDALGVIDVSDFHEAYGVGEFEDPVRDELGHIPYQPDYFHLLGTLVMRFYHSVAAKPYKVIVCDCDGTLWSGVCGEDGPEGVGVYGPFERLQRFLRRRIEQGVLLCLCSKNHEDDVRATFERNAGMRLTLEDCAAVAVNWSPKSDNLRDLAQRLNLGLDSFVFLDDNPVECAEVRAGCPEVLTLQWPADEADASALLDHTWAFDRFVVTEEDGQRTRMYQAEHAREALKETTISYKAFLESLALEVEIRAPNEEELTRVSQLTFRTNQFNFSGRRRTAAEIAALLQDDAADCHIVRARDRFGDYGLVGVLMTRFDERRLVIDSFLLSCRVLGRGVEHRMMAHAGQLAAERGIDEVAIEFRGTRKNEPARRFLESVVASPGAEAGDGESIVAAAGDLRAVRFDPETEASGESDGQTRAVARTSARTPAMDTNERTRRLGSVSAIARAVEQDSTPAGANVPRSHSGSEESPREERDRQVVRRQVLEAFSEALAVPASEIEPASDLDEYVADSYKVVEITVALKRIFPELPPTFLYEYRSIDAIVAALAPSDAMPANMVSNPKQSAARAAHRVRDVEPPDAGDAVAVIGMSCRFPGADSPEAFWELLSEGRSAIGPPPENRWSATERARIGDIRAGFVAEAERFDAGFFNLSPRDALYMDPQQRLYLETIWALLEDGGYTPRTIARDTGVFVGVIANDYGVYAGEAAAAGEVPYRWTDYYQVANRVSYFFDLHGPSLAVDTACSSSGAAIHLACESLRRGECGVAIAGGVNLFLHPSRFVQYRQMGIISETDVCRPFGADADGTVYGEGIGALLLKPLHDAERDGDRIHGVIRGTAMNAGGRTNGFTVPNPQAQAAAVGRALETASVDAGTIGYVEAHGTGTALGDPIEVRGLSEAFSRHTSAPPAVERHCRLGSLKANIGHLESAAAVAGVIKVLLQMRARQLVPSLNAERTNPMIEFEQTPFRVQHELSAWEPPSHAAPETMAPRRAGISSFGAGGANVHVVLEEYPHAEPDAGDPDTPVLVPLSARSGEELRRMARRLCEHLADSAVAPDPERVAYTLQCGREAMAHRLAVIARSTDELVQRLHGFVDGEPDTQAVFEGRVDPRFAQVFHIRDESLHVGSDESGLQRLALLWTSGAVVDWQQRYARVTPAPLSLPTYPFQGRRYYLPRELALADGPARAGSVTNPLLGERLESPFVNGSLYHARYDLQRLGYLADHRIHDHLIVPGALYLALATTAAVREYGDYPHGFANVTFLKAIDLPPEGAVEVQSRWCRDDDAIEVAGRPGDDDAPGEWHTHCTLAYRSAGAHDAGDTAPETLEAVRARCTEPMSAEAFYRHGAAMGFHWTGGFRGIRKLWRGDAEALAEVHLPAELEADMRHCEVHPAFLDACFQPFVAALGEARTRSGDPFLPLGAERVRFHRRLPRATWAHARIVDDHHERSVTFDIVLYDDAGEVCAEFRRMSALRTGRTDLERLRGAAHRDWLYEPRWEAVSVPPHGRSEPRRRLLVVDGDTGESAVAGALEAAGDEIVAVGGRQRPVSEIVAALAAETSDGFGVPTVVVEVPSESRTVETEDDDVVERLQRTWDLLQGVVRLMAEDPRCSARLWLVTHEAQPVSGDESASSLIHGVWWALGRCLAWEHPEFWGGMLDLPAPTSACPSQLVHALFDGALDEDQLAVRDGCYACRLRPSRHADEATEVPVRDDATYLITGGLGSLGRLHADWLLRRGASTLVLVGRSEPDADGGQWLASRRAQGVDLHYRRVDVSDRASLAGLMEEVQERMPPLQGVVHTAGGLDDGLFINQDSDRLWRVLAPKATGAWHLHQLTADRSLDFFVTTSTASVLLGAPGQTNYVLANAFLDALARYRRRRSLPARSVNWGPWDGSRMVAASPGGRRRSWTGVDFGAVPQEHAADLFDAAYEGTAADVAVLPYDWPALVESLAGYTLPSPLRPFRRDGQRHFRSEPSVTDDVGQPPRSAHSCEDVERLLVGKVNALLGYDERNAFDRTASFSDIGFDSLTAVRLRNELNQALDLGLPATVAFDYPSVPVLAAHIVDLMATTEGAAGAHDEAEHGDGDAVGESIRSLSEQEANAALERELVEVAQGHE
ncbi:SDR family NAD(P)-dependent oxidoreductase [Arhodomonas sp. AD133]|uniref:SDR family NAD(P)-dependent oxidoreductase n=1 Tax=Arhodomonas sp. AD133 TaxID=3415009 RepID=UPI003EC0FF6C